MIGLTKSTKPSRKEDVQRNWHLVDVSSLVLGRAATQISRLLQGKHKRTYSPNQDSGDFVVVINAKKVQVTGKKEQTKVYTNYSGYPGGLRKLTLSQLRADKSEEIVRHAVSGMLPKNKLRDRRMARLYIFESEDHKFADKFKN